MLASSVLQLLQMRRELKVSFKTELFQRVVVFNFISSTESNFLNLSGIILFC